jgi:hypothetical protein
MASLQEDLLDKVKNKALSQALPQKLEGLMESRPSYQMPQAASDYFAMEKARLGSEMPGLTQAKGDIGSQTAQGIKNISQSSNSVAGSLGAISDLYSGQMKSLAGLDVAGSQYKQARQDAYEKALLQQDDYQDKTWEWNKAQAYGEKYNYLQSQIAQNREDIRQQKANEAKQEVANTEGLFGLAGEGIKIGGAALLMGI